MAFSDEPNSRLVAFANDDQRLVSGGGYGFTIRDAVLATGQVPDARLSVIERRLLNVTPEDGWEYPVRLATRYLDHLPYSDDSPERAYSRLAGLIREARGRSIAQTFNQGRQMDAVEKVVMQAHNHAWSKYPETSDSGRHFVDFKKPFPRSEHVLAYALTYFHSALQQDVDLRLGSDDGIKVWLNDEIVHRNFAFRAFREREDRIRVHLNEGTNKLLVKLDQSGDRWGFAMEFLDDNGWPVELTWATQQELTSKSQ